MTTQDIDQTDPTATYTREATPEEMKDSAITLIESTASGWDEEARLEEFKGNANRAKIDALRWGAGNLRTLANRVRDLPEEVEIDEDDIDFEFLGDTEWVAQDIAAEQDVSNAQLPLFPNLDPPPPATNEFVEVGATPFPSDTVAPTENSTVNLGENEAE